MSEKRNSSIAQGKPQLTSSLRHRKPHCFLCGTNSSTGENAKKRYCNGMAKARRAEEMQSNVFSLQSEIIAKKPTQRSAVAVTQGKSVVQKRLTKCFRVAELIVRGGSSCPSLCHLSVALPPSPRNDSRKVQKQKLLQLETKCLEDYLFFVS